MIIVSLKYVVIVLRFDNHGEGGVLALLAFAQGAARTPRMRVAVPLVALFAAALFYGDAVITPAISVLSAVEGLSVATPTFETWIVPISIGILVALFAIQRHGTGAMGKLFGPVTRDLVPQHRGARHREHRADAGDPRGAEPVLRRRVLGAVAGARVHRARRGVPRHDRRRGALRRHGPLRRAADPARVVRSRAAVARDQLLRTGRAGAARSARRRESVLPPRARFDAAADGRARHRGDRHRFAGDHLRRVLHHPAGLAPGLPAAHPRAAHLGRRTRTDLHPPRELADARRGARTGRGLRFVHQSRGGLRHRGVRHHAAHHVPDRRGGRRRRAAACACRCSRSSWSSARSS